MECIAPGFRFHPTDEEIVLYYLKRKICRKKLRVNAIGETDVYKYDPQELPGKALYKTGDRQWYFFSPRDRKYGGRASRGTENGYWKATGNDREVMCNSRLVGMKKTLVFHRGKAPKGERTDWVMHEYSLVEEELKSCKNVKDYYVVYKVFKKNGPGPKNGAQYGAPFIEEEWADDDTEDVTESADVDVSANHVTVPADMENTLVNGPNQSELDGYDIEDLMRQIGEEPSHVELSVAPTLQQDELSGLESPVETFNPTNLSRDAYLEIDDLLLSGPEPGSVEAVQENWDLDVSDDVENNRFFDVDSFFLDMDAADPNSSSDPQSEPVRVDLADGVEQQPQVDASSVTNQATDDQVQQQTEANQASDWPLANSVAMSSRMWMQELNNDVLTDTQFVEKPLNVAGTGDASESMNPLSDISIANEDDSSQFTSSLWAYLESIPTSPAYASENPFVNKTPLNISSRGHINLVVTVNNDLTANSMNCRGNNKTKQNKSFFFLSIIGALCAVFWVCVGTVGVSGRSVLW